MCLCFYLVLKSFVSFCNNKAAVVSTVFSGNSVSFSSELSNLGVVAGDLNSVDSWLEVRVALGMDPKLVAGI